MIDESIANMNIYSLVVRRYHCSCNHLYSLRPREPRELFNLLVAKFPSSQAITLLFLRMS